MNPPSWVTNEAQWNKQCRRLIARVTELIGGRVGVIQASRQIRKYGFWLRAQDDPDFQVFAVIDSETDHLPVGAVRQHWASDALEKKDLEIQQAENLFRDKALKAAKNLIEKYKLKR